MKKFLQIIAGVLLLYSVAGIALHALAKIDGFGDHCGILLFSLEEQHLQLFTVTAAMSASLFLIVRKKKRKLRNPV